MWEQLWAPILCSKRLGQIRPGGQQLRSSSKGANHKCKSNKQAKVVNREDLETLRRSPSREDGPVCDGHQSTHRGDSEGSSGPTRTRVFDEAGSVTSSSPKTFYIKTGTSAGRGPETSGDYSPNSTKWHQLEQWLSLSSWNSSADLGTGIIPDLQEYADAKSPFGFHKDEVSLILYILGNITEKAVQSNQSFGVATVLDILYIANQLLNVSSWKPAASTNTALGPHVLQFFESILGAMEETNQTFSVSYENIEFHCLSRPCSSMRNQTALGLPTNVSVSLHEEDSEHDFHASCLVNIMSLSYRGLSMDFPGEYAHNEDPSISFELESRILTNSMLFDKKSYHSAHVNMSFLCDSRDCHPAAICVFWNFSLGKWSSEGCSTEIVDGVANCFCHHLTSFSVLISKFLPQGLLNSSVLDYITKIGLIISIISLVLCISLQAYLLRVTLNLVAYYRHLAILNVSTFLLLSNISFVAATYITPKDYLRLCIALTFCTHFSLLAFFCWTLVQSFFLFCRLVFVFHHITKREFMTLSTVLGYVFPALISMGTFLYYTPTDEYRRETVCWLQSDSGASQAFTIPTIIVLSGNFLVLIVVIRKLLRPSISEGSGEDEEVVKKLVKAVVFCTPQFGLTWAIGIPLLTDSNSLVLHYMFVLLNPLQGFFIFLFSCLLDKKIMDLVKKRFSKNSAFSSTATTLSSY
ncbi:adhesion G-protein coupled receptor F3-like [Spea bombifrons]|uniref:adhesion G-protein coupled receptor F3-like n=1 Tax=Spea bombifrons TaxID=233779 RepID=UPI002349AB78|nr:adhesion G-protein coupled receptor F3-like [Spea bombifrons]